MEEWPATLREGCLGGSAVGTIRSSGRSGNVGRISMHTAEEKAGQESTALKHGKACEAEAVSALRSALTSTHFPGARHAEIDHETQECKNRFESCPEPGLSDGLPYFQKSFNRTYSDIDTPELDDLLMQQSCPNTPKTRRSSEPARTLFSCDRPRRSTWSNDRTTKARNSNTMVIFDDCLTSDRGWHEDINSSFILTAQHQRVLPLVVGVDDMPPPMYQRDSQVSSAVRESVDYVFIPKEDKKTEAMALMPSDLSQNVDAKQISDFVGDIAFEPLAAVSGPQLTAEYFDYCKALGSLDERLSPLKLPDSVLSIIRDTTSTVQEWQKRYSHSVLSEACQVVSKLQSAAHRKSGELCHDAVMFPYVRAAQFAADQDEAFFQKQRSRLESALETAKRFASGVFDVILRGHEHHYFLRSDISLLGTGLDFRDLTVAPQQRVMCDLD